MVIQTHMSEVGAKMGVAFPFVFSLMLQTIDPTTIEGFVNRNGTALVLLFFGGLFFWLQYWPWYKARQDRLDEREADRQKQEGLRHDKLMDTVKEMIESQERTLTAVSGAYSLSVSDLKNAVNELTTRQNRLNDWFFRDTSLKEGGKT